MTNISILAIHLELLTKPTGSMQFSYCNVTIIHLSPFSKKNIWALYFENLLQMLMNVRKAEGWPTGVLL